MDTKLTFIKISALIALLISSFIFSNTANATCQKTGTAITTVSGNSAKSVDNGSGAADSCSDTPDAYKLSFYRMSLCTADPSELDLSTCQDMLPTQSTSVDHTITYPTETIFDIPAFEIAPGTYPYMVAILSNKLGIKHSIQTTNAMTGKSSSSGVYCWTSTAGPSSMANEAVVTPHGTTVSGSTQMITCDSTAGTAVFSYEVINTIQNDNCSDGYAASGDKASMGLIGNGTATISLLQSNTAFATSCANADRFLWTSTLTTALKVTPISSFTMYMRTQDAVSVDFDSDSGNNNILKMGADPVKVYLTVTE